MPSGALWNILRFVTALDLLAESFSGHFWQITDVHVDLDQECSGTAEAWYGNFKNNHFGCGTSEEMVNATAAFLALTAGDADFVFFTGDAPWSGGKLETQKNIHAALSAAIPDTPLFFLLGNHDFPGPPLGEAATNWYPQVAQLWGDSLDKQALGDFSVFGYWSMLAPGSTSVRLVALNTEHFNHGNPYVAAGATLDLGLAQLRWLNVTLKAAALNGESAWIFGHVPPGIETGYLNDHSTAEAAGMGDVRPNWVSLFVKLYTDIVDVHAATAVFQSFGHEHVDTFRLAGSSSVLFSVPSLSTGYPRTNPTVRLWRSESGAVVDWTQYHMNLIESNEAHEPKWSRSYTASQAYGIADLSRSTMEALLGRFKLESDQGANASTHMYEAERRFFMSSTPEEFQPVCDAWCQVNDLCDKEFGANDGTEVGFTGCVYWRGHGLLG